MDSTAPQTPGPPPCFRYKRCPATEGSGDKTDGWNDDTKLTDKYTIKRNKIRNQITLLRGQTEEGVAFFLDKVEETIHTCDNLLLTWRTHGTPLGDRKVKETMYGTVTKILEEIDHWRDNSSTEDTLDSLTSVETLIKKIHEMNHAILKEEEDATPEFPSILKLLIKKIISRVTILLLDSGGMT